jgi:peroxiredoxin
MCAGPSFSPQQAKGKRLPDDRPVTSSETQESNLSDTITLKLVDSEGLPVSGAKVGTHVHSRDDTFFGLLKWSLRGYAINISDEQGQITLTPQKLFFQLAPSGRTMGLCTLHEGRKIGAIFDIAKNDKRQVIELTLVPVCHVHGKLESKDLKKVGRPAPEIGPIKAWKNGTPVTLSELIGKAVVVHFGGKAPSTSKSLRQLAELHEEFESKGLVIIALYNSVSMEAWEKELVKNNERYGGQREIPFRVAVDGGESSYYEESDKIRLGATYADYDITSLPTTILIDVHGMVVGQFGVYDIREKLGPVLGIAIKAKRRTWR